MMTHTRPKGCLVQKANTVLLCDVSLKLQCFYTNVIFVCERVNLYLTKDFT